MSTTMQIHEKKQTTLPTENEASCEHLGAPDQIVTDKIWLLSACVLSIILVGSFLTLAFASFHFVPENAANLQMVLTIFTTTISFLGGLFCTNPLQKKEKS